MTIWRYGDDVNTDQLFPGKYTYTCSTPEEIKPHLLEDLDPDFADGVEEGDLILAGHNFGGGSSREQPVVGLKAVGIRTIVAKSFARIFYRAGLNQGLILVECPAAVEAYEPGDDVHVDVKKGVVSVAGESYGFPPLPDRILAIREAGGLLPYTRQLLQEQG